MGTSHTSKPPRAIMTAAVGIVIAICGGSCSGKTTLANQLVQHLQRVNLAAATVPLDSFYVDRSHVPVQERDRIDYDSLESLDVAEALSAISLLKAGSDAPLPRYDVRTHCRVGVDRIGPTDITIIDGCFVLAIPGIRDLLDVAFFLEVPRDVRFTRRLARDLKTGFGPSDIVDYWQRYVEPAYRSIVRPSLDANDTFLSLDDVESGQALTTILRRVAHLANARQRTAYLPGGLLSPP